jgi:hypothetical protein
MAQRGCADFAPWAQNPGRQRLAAGPAAAAGLSMKAQRARLPDGRWHLQHGPMDIVIGAEGESLAVQLAHDAAWQRFYTCWPSWWPS